MKIRYRWEAPLDAPRPMHGDYLMSAPERARGGYLILGCDDRGPRGGLGQPVYQLFVLTVERVSKAECLAHPDRLFSIKWDSRKRRAPHRFTDETRLEGAPA